MLVGHDEGAHAAHALPGEGSRTRPVIADNADVVRPRTEIDVNRVHGILSPNLFGMRRPLPHSKVLIESPVPWPCPERSARLPHPRRAGNRALALGRCTARSVEGPLSPRRARSASARAAPDFARVARS